MIPSPEPKSNEDDGDDDEGNGKANDLRSLIRVWIHGTVQQWYDLGKKDGSRSQRYVRAW
jgi:hypothetical protein